MAESTTSSTTTHTYETISLRGILRGHGGWVTSISTSSETPDRLLTGSRDKTVMVWKLTRDASEPQRYGIAQKALKGHSHFVQDVVSSSDGQFALSASWDGTLRLWDLQLGSTAHRFVGHTKDVLSAAFSSDNRQIVSGSCDRTVKLWNTLGECKYTMEEQGHTEWASCVRFANTFDGQKQQTLIVSAGWDKVVKVWSLNNCKLRNNLYGHTGYINTVAVSPDGSLCASGGKDGIAILWDLNQGKHLYSLTDAGDIIYALCFSPIRYWLCAATARGILIWDLERKTVAAVLDHKATAFYLPSQDARQVPTCISLAWSADGYTLYAGYTDNLVRVWEVTRSSA